MAHSPANLPQRVSSLLFPDLTTEDNGVSTVLTVKAFLPEAEIVYIITLLHNLKYVKRVSSLYFYKFKFIKLICFKVSQYKLKLMSVIFNVLQFGL